MVAVVGVVADAEAVVVLARLRVQVALAVRVLLVPRVLREKGHRKASVVAVSRASPGVLTTLSGRAGARAVRSAAVSAGPGRGSRIFPPPYAHFASLTC